MIEVKKTKTMGRGVFATQDIKINTKIHAAHFIKVKDKEIDRCPALARYAFKHSNVYSALCLGVGSLFNHSNTPSVEAYFNHTKHGEVMEFWSKADIKAGDELFISYGGDEYAFKHLLK